MIFPVGDSVCVNGVCSTVTKMTATSVFFDYMEETLRKSNFDKLSVDDHVNLELSLTPSTKMGGHFVTGHIDCVGTISQFDIKDPWAILKIQFPDSFAPYIIPKGSVAIDGISLTVVDAGKNELSCHLIPHTLQETILSDKKVGDSVNLEFDMIGKYLFRFKKFRRTMKTIDVKQAVQQLQNAKPIIIIDQEKGFSQVSLLLRVIFSPKISSSI